MLKASASLRMSSNILVVPTHWDHMDYIQSTTVSSGCTTIWDQLRSQCSALNKISVHIHIHREPGTLWEGTAQRWPLLYTLYLQKEPFQSTSWCSSGHSLSGLSSGCLGCACCPSKREPQRICLICC